MGLWCRLFKLTQRDDEMRVYVVTINTPPEYAWIHDRFRSI